MVLKSRLRKHTGAPVPRTRTVRTVARTTETSRACLARRWMATRTIQTRGTPPPSDRATRAPRQQQQAGCSLLRMTSDDSSEDEDGRRRLKSPASLCLGVVKAESHAGVRAARLRPWLVRRWWRQGESAASLKHGARQLHALLDARSRMATARRVGGVELGGRSGVLAVPLRQQHGEPAAPHRPPAARPPLSRAPPRAV